MYNFFYWPIRVAKHCHLDGTAQRTAMLYTFFAACKHHGIDPEKWLTDVLNRINDHKVSQLKELMPQSWRPATDKNPANPEEQPQRVTSQTLTSGVGLGVCGLEHMWPAGFIFVAEHFVPAGFSCCCY